MSTGDSYRAIADAKIYCGLASAISNYGHKSAVADASDSKADLELLLSTYGTLLSTQSDKLEVSSIENITRLILIYSSPLQVSLKEVLLLVLSLQQEFTTDEEEANDIEEFANYVAIKVPLDLNGLPDTAIIEMAQEILTDVNAKCLEMKYLSNSVDNVFLLIKAKLYIDSKYLDTFEIPAELLPLVDGDPEFDHWLSGIYKPYEYYWQNYGVIAGNKITKFHNAIHIESLDELFLVFIYPLTIPTYSNKLLTSNWLWNVIVPFLCYKGFDLQPLKQWMFSTELSIVQRHQLWKKIFEAIVTKEVPFEHYEDMVHTYLGACYYNTNEKKLSSIDMLKVFDSIKETTHLLVPVVPTTSNHTTRSVTYDPNEQFSTLAEFIDQTSIKELLQPSKFGIISLAETIETCIKLYPINQLAIHNYLEFRYSPGSNFFLREVSKILVGLRLQNAPQLLQSIDLFKSSFVTERSDVEAVDKLIIERLLSSDLFDLVGEVYNQLSIPEEALYLLILKKFWDSLISARSLSEKSEGLSHATSSISLIDKLSVSQEARGEVTRLKHLLKVFANIKNFKLSFERNKSPTPSDIIKRFGSTPTYEELRTELEATSPMGLITSILEQNSKSYLAFDKLFKVLNDFLIYLNDASDNSSYYFRRLTAACIEAALIDNNFSYAYKKSLELLERYDPVSGDLNNMWMTFYQVGKYHSPDETSDSGKLDILTKESEVLAKYLSVISRTSGTVDNSQIIVELWQKVNDAIQDWYEQAGETKESASRDLQQNITDTANEILSDAANTTSQASEKLSNLFASGLGWAIGANQ